MALLRGTLDVLVLKALSWTPLHAYEIARWLESRSEGRLTIEDAALLQALHRMEERTWIVAEWGITENGRRARYYKLTAGGKAHLRDEADRLVDDVDALTTILALKKA
jgi:PadR family transcriptional regulator, regulatory protein PadR